MNLNSKNQFNYFLEYFQEISKSITTVDLKSFEAAANLTLSASSKGGKIIFAGNGGSAAMASHLSVDFTKVAKIRAINFNEADLITCFANDYGYENWVSRALDAYADSNDVFVAISSSGKSPNILNGVTAAKKIGLKIISFSGFKSDNPLSKAGDLNFWCNSEEYNIIEMTHHIWLLSIVDYIAKLQNK